MTAYSIPEMTCGHCKSAIEKAVRAHDPAATLRFDMAAHQVQIDTTMTQTALLAALADQGYPATPL
jgi:copper chaperone